jgi:hypothetical protein
MVKKSGNITAEPRAQKRIVDFHGEEGIQRLLSCYFYWAVSSTGKVYIPCPIMSQNGKVSYLEGERYCSELNCVPSSKFMC